MKKHDFILWSDVAKKNALGKVGGKRGGEKRARGDLVHRIEYTQ